MCLLEVGESIENQTSDLPKTLLHAVISISQLQFHPSVIAQTKHTFSHNWFYFLLLHTAILATNLTFILNISRIQPWFTTTTANSLV